MITRGPPYKGPLEHSCHAVRHAGAACGFVVRQSGDESMLVRDVSNCRMTPCWSRSAVAVFFFINGAALASWVLHIPAIRSRHMMSDGQLGLVLLSMAAGSVLALPVAGWLVSRLGSRLM